MSRTDVLALNEHKIIKTIRETLPENVKNSTNILTVRDDILFLWNSKDCCVFALNLRLYHDKKQDVPFQTLLSLQPIHIDVNMIRVNDVVSMIALAGPNGVSVLQLPRRGGLNGTFGNGKDVLYCRNHILDERLFTCSKFVKCKQVKWHPGSPEDNHLLVLTSENIIRVYKVTSESANLQRLWQIGHKPMGGFGTSNIPILVTLGETGVDFDFGPPETVKNSRRPEDKTWNNLVWPIYVLRGNGEVFTLMTSVNKELFEDAKLCGPLLMRPITDDNYGADACAILCLQSTPTVLSISTCTGTVYHSVVLSNEEEINATEEWASSDISSRPTKSLYVFEIIELELGLSSSDIDSTLTCPIFFHRDERIKSRYFCMHNAGVHVIVVPMVDYLESYVEASEGKYDPILMTRPELSTVEYIVCTHATSSAKVNPIFGLTLFYNPVTLIAFLGSGEIVSLPLISIILSAHKAPTNDEDESTEIISPTKKILKQPFHEYIQALLAPNFSQPILKLDAADASKPKEQYELLIRATQTFREDHFQRYEKVKEEIEKRVHALQMLKDYQLKELKRLEEEKELSQATAEKLAERYEEIKDKQEELIQRAEKLVRLVSQREPKEQSVAEKKMLEDLKRDETKLNNFVKMMEQVRKKVQYQGLQIQQWRAEQKKDENHLGKLQTETIKSTLSLVAADIIDLKNEINKCKQTLGME